MLDVMQYTVGMAGNFWRGIYSHGVWIPRATAASYCFYGWRVVVACLTCVQRVQGLGFRV